MSIYSLDEFTPDISVDAWVSRESTIIGNVTVGSEVSVWPGAVVRADNDRIVIGDRSNIQECAVLHTDTGYVLELGHDVSIGHQAMLHGCKVGARALIGIQAVVLNGATIGEDCLIGAGALVTTGTVIPPRTLALGSPAKVVRELNDAEVAKLASVSESYVGRAKRYRGALKLVSE